MALARLVITGASGLIGTHLVPSLREAGWEVLRLVRREPAPGSGEARWRPETGVLDPAILSGAVAVIHLGGESLAAGPWTASRRAAILDSRVRSTRLLAEALAGLPAPRPTLLAASAVGLYGDRGGEPLTEASPPGSGFLAEVC
jgi:NAD dependent epimerase/dehydratase family enzyme